MIGRRRRISDGGNQEGRVGDSFTKGENLAGACVAVFKPKTLKEIAANCHNTFC